jgi:hypothetical protein
MNGMLPLAEAAQRPTNFAMNEDIFLPFDLPAVARKKVSAAFDGGRITSDGGVMLLAQAERRLGIADQLARVIPDERDAGGDSRLKLRRRGCSGVGKK